MSDVTLPIPVPNLVSCEARLPIDHVLSMVRLIREGNANVPNILKHISQITCELSEFLVDWIPLTDGTVTVSDAEVALLEQDASYLNTYVMTTTKDPNPHITTEVAEAVEAVFNITPWIPVILLIIELIIKRRK